MEGMTYAKHGEKKALGRLAHINGKRAVAFVDKDNQIRAYTTIDEINDMFYEKKDIPDCHLDF